MVPIELIDAICRENYGAWSSLIRTCKQIHKALIDYRWEAKCITRRVLQFRRILEKMYTIKLYHDSTQKSHSARHDAYTTRDIIVRDDGEYWQLRRIFYVSGHHTTGESVSFDKDKVDEIIWRVDGNIVGQYISTRRDGERYRNVGYVYKPTQEMVYYTKDEMMARLDAHGVPYVWLKYLPHAN